MKYFIFLFGAIFFETFATTALKATEQFTKPIPSALTLLGYAVSFYLLSLTLQKIPVGIAYAMWSGIGIVLISTLGFFIYKQRLDMPAMLGLGLIIAGVIVINVFSKSATH